MHSDIPKDTATIVFIDSRIFFGMNLIRRDHMVLHGRPRKSPATQGLSKKQGARPAYFLAYSNLGSAFSASLVAPGSVILLFSTRNWFTGMATSCLPMPRKPPAPTMA